MCVCLYVYACIICGGHHGKLFGSESESRLQCNRYTLIVIEKTSP